MPLNYGYFGKPVVLLKAAKEPCKTQTVPIASAVRILVFWKIGLQDIATVNIIEL